MVTQSKSNLFLIPAAFIFLSYATYVLLEDLLSFGFMRPVLLLVLVGIIWALVFAGSDIFITWFKSPQRIELSANQLSLKKRLAQPVFLPVLNVVAITNKKFWQITGTYSIRMVCKQPRRIYYLSKATHDGLKEFFNDLKKANPSCQIDAILK